MQERAAATGCSLRTVSGILSKAKAIGITYPVEMTAKQLGSAMYSPKDGTGEEKYFEPDLEYIHHTALIFKAKEALGMEKIFSSTPTLIIYRS
jgi:hypothetical protein